MRSRNTGAYEGIKRLLCLSPCLTPHLGHLPIPKDRGRLFLNAGRGGTYL